MEYKNIAKITVLLSIFPAIYYSMFPGKITIVTIICLYPLLIISIIQIFKKGVKSFEGINYINFFFIYCILILIRGILNLNSFQDWTNFLSADLSMLVLMPIIIYFGTKIEFYLMLKKTFIFLGVGLSFIILFNTNNAGPFGFTRMISPIYFFILMTPYLSKKSTLFILLITFISFFSDITIRSNLINIFLSIIISFSYIYRWKRHLFHFIKILRRIFLFAPVLFLILGSTGIFNIFTLGNSFEVYTFSNNEGQEQELLRDTRTAIYEDVFVQLRKDNRFFLGLGAEGKTKTHLTEVENADFDIIYKEGRRGTESGMLNYIQIGGIIGGAFYLMLFIKSSYNAIYKSNNWFMVMLGLFISFKGFYSFVEDPSIFTITTIFMFAAIGLCFNKRVRNCNDEEIKKLFKNIFINFKFKLNQN